MRDAAIQTGKPSDFVGSAFAYLDVANPLVAWQVYRGAMISPAAIHESALSFWMTQYLRSVHKGEPRKSRLRAELELDEIRKRDHPLAVSRLHGFFAFPDQESARRAGEAWPGRHFQADCLAEIGIRGNARVSRYDSEWISHELGSSDRSWADDYFSGKAYDKDPIWEVLIEGKAIVFGTELRKVAYATVRRFWPKSLALLELGRVGAELGSDIGLITPMLLPNEAGSQLVYCISMEDAKKEDFLRKLATFDGPKNIADLNAHSDLVPPDLRRGFFQL